MDIFVNHQNEQITTDNLNGAYDEKTKNSSLHLDYSRTYTYEAENKTEVVEDAVKSIINEYQLSDNMQLQNDTLARNGKAVADKAANGKPIEEQAPAKKTQKQKKEDKKRDIKAQKFNAKADHVSYNMVEQLQNRKKAADKYIENRSRKNQIEKSGLDKEMLKAYYQEGDTGFIDKYIGAAVSEKKAEQEKDESKKAALKTKAQEERKEALDIVVDDLFKAQITPDMLKPAYLETHMGEMKALADRMRNFKAIREDSKNKFYFESDDPVISGRLDLLKMKLDFGLAETFYQQLDYVAGQKAVDVANGDYLTNDQESVVTKDHSEQLALELQLYNGAVQETKAGIVDDAIRIQLSKNTMINERVHPDEYHTMMTMDITEKEQLQALAEAYKAVYEAHSKTWIADDVKAKQEAYEELLRQLELEEQVRLSSENAGNAE